MKFDLLIGAVYLVSTFSPGVAQAYQRISNGKGISCDGQVFVNLQQDCHPEIVATHEIDTHTRDDSGREIYKLIKSNANQGCLFTAVSFSFQATGDFSKSVALPAQGLSIDAADVSANGYTEEEVSHGYIVKESDTSIEYVQYEPAREAEQIRSRIDSELIREIYQNAAVTYDSIQHTLTIQIDSKFGSFTVAQTGIDLESGHAVSGFFRDLGETSAPSPFGQEKASLSIDCGTQHD